MKTSARNSGFTLIELLMVIAIIGILAAVVGPSVVNLRATDALAASTRQLLDDVARARQYAISQRTTVYMVFCPSNFWNDPAYSVVNASLTERPKAERLFGRQLVGYNFVTLRSIGDQPGQNSARYLGAWRNLPEGAIIPDFKFRPRSAPPVIIQDPAPPATPVLRSFTIPGFDVATNIPFPSVSAPWLLVGGIKTWVRLPYIAFNHLGQLDSGVDEYIPVARGSVGHVRDAAKVPIQAAPAVNENPPGNSTNAYLLVHIDWLTGRARLEKQELP